MLKSWNSFSTDPPKNITAKDFYDGDICWFGFRWNWEEAHLACSLLLNLLVAKLLLSKHDRSRIGSSSIFFHPVYAPWYEWI